MARTKRVPEVSSRIVWSGILEALIVGYLFEVSSQQIAKDPERIKFLDWVEKIQKNSVLSFSRLKSKEFLDAVKQQDLRWLYDLAKTLAPLYKSHYKRELSLEEQRCAIHKIVSTHPAFIHVTESLIPKIVERILPLERKGEKVFRQSPRTASEAAQFKVQKLFGKSPTTMKAAASGKAKTKAPEVDLKSTGFIKFVLERLWRIDPARSGDVAHVIQRCIAERETQSKADFVKAGMAHKK